MSTFYPDNETVQIQIADDEGFLFPLKDQIEDYWDASRAHMHSALRLSTRTAGSTARVAATYPAWQLELALPSDRPVWKRKPSQRSRCGDLRES